LLKKVGILFHPKVAAAQALVQQLVEAVADLNASVWQCSAWDEEAAKEHLDSTELVICLGGDGTILRATRIVAPLPIPILGINFGRLGFMTELSAGEALSHVPDFVRGEGWIDERAMLAVELGSGELTSLQALNDVVVARGERARVIRVKAVIDGDVLTTYICDGVIVATATGSTGYSLAAGGPILHPQAKDILLQPVSSHLSIATALVLPPETTVELEVNGYHQAILSIDGQVEVPLRSGDVVKVKLSSYTARLLRVQNPNRFYGTLVEKLTRKREQI